MAQIDPSIVLGVKPVQIENPLAVQGRAMEGAVNALKYQELQRGLQEEQEVRNFLRNADLSKPETRAQLSQFGKTGLGYGKLLAEQEKAGLETTKLRKDIDKQTLEAHRQRVSDLAFNPSDENVLAHLQDSVLRGEINPEQAKQQWSQVGAMKPEQRKDYFLKMGVNADKRLEMMTLSEAQKQDLAIKRERLQKDFDPELQAKISNAKEYGQALGKNRATAEAALPGAIQTAEEGIRLIDEMVGKPEIKDASGKVIQKGTKPHPGFSSYVGATLVPGMRFIEGSDTAAFEVRQKQIEGRAFLEAFNALKGGGSITEKEGEKGTQAIMRMNKASNEKEYITAARELQDVLRTGMQRARAKAGQTSPVVTPSATPATAPRTGAPAGSENVIDFNSLK
jgi:hypothetical protein